MAIYMSRRFYSLNIPQFFISFFVLYISVFSTNSFAETLEEYVQKCKENVEFTNLPELNCKQDGSLFLEIDQTPINDFVGYKRINDRVDYVFACRWVSGFSGESARGVEAIVHNRSNGNTCFFSAKLTMQESSNNTELTRASATITPPTAANASSYWDSPIYVNEHVRCVNCHVAGPYIATASIAPFIARFGLMNNGHDTMGDPLRYIVVGDTFESWNRAIQNHIGNPPNESLVPQNCADSCHVLGGKSTQAKRLGPGDFFTLQSSPIEHFIVDSILNGSMPPLDPESDYRWSNLDTPNGSGDHETLNRLKETYKHLHCDSPKKLQAMAVGDDGHVFDTGDAPNKLRTFNLRDGLICLDSDQESGKCRSYETRYKCDGEWTEWRNLDSSTNNGGEYERRSTFTSQYGLCASPTDIEARVQIFNGQSLITIAQFYGPRDRLATFDKKKGLACLNADQGAGEKCSNYTVRFICE